MQVSLHGSRLTVTLEASEPEYLSRLNDGPRTSEYLARLKQAIQDELAQRISVPFSTNKDEKQSNQVALVRLGLYLAKVRVAVKSVVTNIGSKPSSLKETTWYLAEDTDGRKQTIDVVTKGLSGKVKLPESEPVALDNVAPSIDFEGFGGLRLLEYETVRIVQDSLRRFATNEKSVAVLSDPYLRLLHMHDLQRRDRALRIADPLHRSRIILGVEVTDIYGRMAHAEVVLRDASKWNQREP
jgi:hypothetical protein